MILERGTLPLHEISGISRFNARADRLDDASIDALVPSIIATKGPFEPLIVTVDHHGTDKHWTVLAGRRRYHATLRAIEQGADIAAIVPVSFFEGTEAEARELSLAENYCREAMTPVEEVTAFRRCAEAGLKTAEIAKDFGVTERHVRQRLALANLSPKILAAWADGSIRVEDAQAFASSTDHAAQDVLFDKHPHLRRDPAKIRKALRGEAVTGETPIVRFVGLSAYVKAGGRIEEDLFDDAAWLTDATLLQRLAEEKLEAIGTRIQKAEGWGWVRTEFGPTKFEQMITSHEDQPDYTEADENRHDEIADEIRTLPIGSEDHTRLLLEFEQLEARAWTRGVPAARRKKLGIYLGIGYDGDLSIERAMQMKTDADTNEDDQPKAKPTAFKVPPHDPKLDIYRNTVNKAIAVTASQSIHFAMALFVAQSAAGWNDNLLGLALPTLDNDVKAPPSRLIMDILHLTGEDKMAQAIRLCMAAPVNILTQAFCEIIADCVMDEGVTAYDDAIARATLNAAQEQGLPIGLAMRDSFNRADYAKATSTPLNEDADFLPAELLAISPEAANKPADTAAAVSADDEDISDPDLDAALRGEDIDDDLPFDFKIASLLRSFLDAETAPSSDPKEFPKASLIHDAFNAYLIENNHDAITMTEFSNAMKLAGYTNHRRKTGIYWLNLKLTEKGQ